MRRKMRIRVTIAAFVLCLSIAATLFAMATYAVAELAGIPPVHQIDVITRENDLLLVTSNWPESFTIENRSSKNISGFQLSIIADEDDGGPMRYVRWGFMPIDGKLQTDFLEPKEKITVPIEEEIVDTFVKNGKSLLYVQQAYVWADNDFTTLYSFGRTLKQDPNNPKRYVVVKGERHKHHATPYLKHSIEPLKPLGCCTHEYDDFVYVDCDGNDPCQPLPPPDPPRKCHVANNSYTVSSSCSNDIQTLKYVVCQSQYANCPTFYCSVEKRVTSTRPCMCCGC